MKYCFFLLAVLLSFQPLHGQNQSIARDWNEAVLFAIRNDFARPTVHARNLFHTSIAMYDIWALQDSLAVPYLLGNKLGDFNSDFNSEEYIANNSQEFIDEAASYAVYRILKYRFRNSPGNLKSSHYFDSLMYHYGYDLSIDAVSYKDGRAATLGNFVALEILNYGFLDGSNEAIDYNNVFYEPVNPPLILNLPGNPNIDNPDRWQPLAFDLFIDQSGNPIANDIPEFLSPEWGNVHGFTVNTKNAQKFLRDDTDNAYYVHHDPGPPPYILGDERDVENYQWGFALVSHWSSHLDPSDEVMWDISPQSIGNIQQLPASIEDYPTFYKAAGGDPSIGHALNPKTNLPYEQQIVPRGDYTRVLAEFWADGPDSETPPGHWFTILNYVMDQPGFEKKFKGIDLVENPYEYDAKAYFSLGAAMHDAAIASWSLKGWYDYVRPISAIRYMNEQGQSTNDQLSSYHFRGLPLTEGLIELVEDGDPLATSQTVGKIKVKAWRGPETISDPLTQTAGVGWILAENWWPYQRPTFVTPPFAGYVSGHSTYSRAAAEILTILTGDPFFPGGMGEFRAPKNDFLVFENGPSVDVTLQWATYRDASDQCSLSRIWGGIHPPADDIPGRKIGIKIAKEVFRRADEYFNGVIPLSRKEYQTEILNVYPNPVSRGEFVTVSSPLSDVLTVFDSQGKSILKINTDHTHQTIDSSIFQRGIYFVKSEQTNHVSRLLVR